MWLPSGLVTTWLLSSANVLSHKENFSVREKHKLRSNDLLFSVFPRKNRISGIGVARSFIFVPSYFPGLHYKLNIPSTLKVTDRK